VSNKDLALYCCDNATDPVSLEQERPQIEYELTLPGRSALDLLSGDPISLPFGRGKVLLTFLPGQPQEVTCLWKGEKYSPGAVVKQDDNECHRCLEDGTWSIGKPCSDTA
jgi:hypothetical protein